MSRPCSRIETFFLIKPDAVRRGLIGTVLGRIEAADFAITDLRVVRARRPVVVMHYKEHAEKEWFGDLVASLENRTVVIGRASWMTNPGLSVMRMRIIVGRYDRREPGTIRGDFAIDARQNSIHASDSDEAAERETELWFGDASTAVGRAGGDAPGR